MTRCTDTCSLYAIDYHDVTSILTRVHAEYIPYWL